MIIKLNDTIPLKGKKFIFLDRDGTINVERNYLYEISKFEFEYKAVEGLISLASQDFNLIIITNQSGIGRGYYTIKDFTMLQSYIIRKCSSYGVEFLGYVACPHYKENCECRKPKDGMLRAIQERFEIDKEYSWIVGDKVSDTETGRSLGYQSCLLGTVHGKNNFEHKSDNTYFVKNLSEFANLVRKTNERLY